MVLQACSSRGSEGRGGGAESFGQSEAGCVSVCWEQKTEGLLPSIGNTRETIRYRGQGSKHRDVLHLSVYRDLGDLGTQGLSHPPCSGLQEVSTRDKWRQSSCLDGPHH